MAVERHGRNQDAPTGRNPWPVGLALALAAMIGASLTVLGIAIAYPDARVEAHPLARDGAPPRPAD